ncbi:MAG: hypothetical protein MJZ17_11760 [Bacteroidales bacterium]|nr:hypothetical protein [Bacteroidales bacterium]
MSCLLPFLCSCVKEVTMDAREDPQTVVECILCDEPVQTLYLTYTKGASREAAPSLDEADAVLDRPDGRTGGRAFHKSRGRLLAAVSTRMDEHILLVKDEILPEMGVTDFNVFVEIK